jgi:hypothetical protein
MRVEHERGPDAVKAEVRRFWLGRLLLAVALVALGGVVFWYFANPRRSEATGIAACAAMYGRAASAADTAQVDMSWPFPLTRGEHNGMRCGELRAAGLLRRE